MKSLGIFLALLVSVTSMKAGQNRILNGSFEQTGGAGVSNHGFGITNWTIDPNFGGIDIILPGDGVGHYWLAEDGTTSLSLNWESPAKISQEVKTAPGKAYDLRFYMAAEIFGGPGTRTMNVLWDGVVVDSPSFQYTGQGPTDMGWQKFDYQVVGTGTDTVSFQSTTPNNFGPALDNVSLVAMSGSGTGTSRTHSGVRFSALLATDGTAGNAIITPVTNASILKAVIASGSSGVTSPGILDVTIDPSDFEIDVINRSTHQIVSTIGQQGHGFEILGDINSGPASRACEKFTATGYTISIPGYSTLNTNINYQSVSGPMGDSASQVIISFAGGNGVATPSIYLQGTITKRPTLYNFR